MLLAFSPRERANDSTYLLSSLESSPNSPRDSLWTKYCRLRRIDPVGAKAIALLIDDFYDRTQGR